MRLTRVLCLTIWFIGHFSTVSWAESQIVINKVDDYISVSTSPYVFAFVLENTQESWEVSFWFSDFGKENENDVWKSGRQRWEFNILSKASEPVFIREIIVIYSGEKQIVKKYKLQEDVLFIPGEMAYEQKGVLAFKDKETAEVFAAATKVWLKLRDIKGILKEIEIPPELLAEWQTAAKIIQRRKTNYNKIIEQFHA